MTTHMCAHSICQNKTEGLFCDFCKKEVNEYSDKCAKARNLMKILGIVENEYIVHITTLYDIFMDDEKMNMVISKLKLKAFW